MARRIRARVWAVAPLKDWRQFNHPWKGESLPFSFCALLCAERVAQWADIYGGKEPVAYLFEGGSQGQSLMLEAFNTLSSGPLGKKYYIGSRSIDDKKRPELQAADVHSYEVRKHFVNDVTGRARIRRSSFHRILDIPDVGGYVVTAKAIEDWYLRAIDGTGGGLDLKPTTLSHDAICRLREAPLEQEEKS
jgi:hypothetical protein